ncbi:unnamed protein product [Orchesella dallaii]|uniref:Uncharacterized protein n=1 Tax=Orchesella dallaii TaxID=48710 RepID=A0ABP1PHY2_9HEXA
MNKALYSLLFCVWLKPKVSEASYLEFPFHFTSDCFVTIVNTNSTELSPTSQLLNDANYAHSYSFHHIDNLNFGFTDYESSTSKNLATNQDFPSPTFRHRSNCLIFLLLTQTLEETLEAIDTSGYGTSEDVLFLIPRDSIFTSDSLISGFISTALFEVGNEPFHADVLFYDGQNSAAIFCLYCPDKLQYVPFEMANISYTALKNLSKILKSNGHQTKLSIKATLPGYDYEEECIRILKRRLPECGHMDLLTVAALQPVLNVTLVQPGAYPIVDTNNWFLSIREEQVLFSHMEYLPVRGFVLLTRGEAFDVLACINKKEFLAFEFKFTSDIDTPIWVCVVLIGVLYGFIYNNIFKGMDLLWATLGKEFSWNHRRSLIFVYLIGSLFLFCCYQSTISAESLKLIALPDFENFRKSGYKLAVPDFKNILFGLKTLPSSTYSKIEAMWGPADDAFYNVTGNLNDWSYYHNWKVIAPVITKQKLFLSSIVAPQILGQFKTDEAYIDHDTICKLFHLSNQFPMSLNMKLRSWSYMSAQFNYLYQKFIEVGIHNRFVYHAFWYFSILSSDVERNYLPPLGLAAVKFLLEIERKFEVMQRFRQSGTIQRLQSANIIRVVSIDVSTERDESDIIS